MKYQIVGQDAPPLLFLERENTMAKETVKEFVIDCIKQHRGDDLYRAQCAFGNCTPTEMNELYGESGQTRQQIIDGYKAHQQKCNEAIETVKRFL